MKAATSRDYRRLDVESSAHSYPVFVGNGLLDRVPELLTGLPFVRPAAGCAVITDSVVGPLLATRVLAGLHALGCHPTLITVPAGEASKSMAETERVATAMTSAGIDRHGFVVALGGGVVGDLAGFVASIYYRGLPVVQLPTTVLAQVDSSVGGKTGVNSPAGKNLLGTFHPPAAVLADVGALATLPGRVFNEGCAEIIKHAIIRDRAMFDHLFDFDRTLRDETPADLIARNIAIKAAIVAADEFERTGQRALLNFGHTVGHALEQAAGYGTLLHGEAIAIGLVAAGRLSMEKAGLPAADFQRLLDLLQHFQLPAQLPAGLALSAVMDALRHDKKFERGAVRFVLTPRFGEAFVSAPGQVELEDIHRVIAALQS